MTQVVFGANQALILTVRREVQSRLWTFQLRIERADWESLLQVRGFDARMAYFRARAFWDYLAERNADMLMPQGRDERATPSCLLERRAQTIQLAQEWQEFARRDD
jgi:hypothetical protein